MKSQPAFSQKPGPSRIAPLFLAVVLGFGAPAQEAAAADALTTATSSAVSKNFLGSLFQKKRTVVDTSMTPTPTAMERVNRSILGLPLGILRGLGKGVSRMASKTVTDHITHN